MKPYAVFFKKELLEYARTYKLMVMLIVFIIFAMLSPLTAKLLPQIMASVMTEGITITLPDPSALDAWTQFFKNVSQMGLIVTVILFSGVVSGEIAKGTLVNMLTKGIGRPAVILSKFPAMAAVWTLCYALAFFICWGYTVYLFPGAALPNLGFSVFCLWLWGIFLLAALLFGSSLSRSGYGALLAAGALLVVLSLLGLFPALKTYNPLALSESNVALLTGDAAVGDLTWPIAIAAAATIAFLFAAVAVFRKRRL
jgi:ABC-2 type transport system permease protein